MKLGAVWPIVSRQREVAALRSCGMHGEGQTKGKMQTGEEGTGIVLHARKEEWEQQYKGQN